MTDPQIPSPSALVTPAIDALVALRPAALPYINSGQGRYAHLVAGWRAQAAVHVARWAKEAKSARLDTAEGEELRELVQSEFDVHLNFDPQPAVGHIALQRSISGPQDTVRRGDIFTKAANPTAKPVPIPAAQYEATNSVIIPSGTFNLISVQVRALRPGTQGNIPQQTNNPSFSQGFVVKQDPFIDPNITILGAFCGGGSSGVPDALLRRVAKAAYLGQYGPTETAAIAGAYLTGGARYLAYFDNPGVTANGPNAGLVLPIAGAVVADESWGFSQIYANKVTQYIADAYLGFGCRVVGSTVSNIFIQLQCAVQLKTSQYMHDTRDIDTAIKKACKSYFDDRIDWYTFRLAGLRAAITAAHSKIQLCTSASVLDYFTASPYSEPPAVGSAGNLGELIHYYLPDEAVAITFAPPS